MEDEIVIGVDEDIQHRIQCLLERRSEPASEQDVAKEALLIGLSALESALDELEELSS